MQHVTPSEVDLPQAEALHEMFRAGSTIQCQQAYRLQCWTQHISIRETESSCCFVAVCQHGKTVGKSEAAHGAGKQTRNCGQATVGELPFATPRRSWSTIRSEDFFFPIGSPFLQLAAAILRYSPGMNNGAGCETRETRPATTIRKDISRLNDLLQSRTNCSQGSGGAAGGPRRRGPPRGARPFNLRLRARVVLAAAAQRPMPTARAPLSAQAGE